MVVWLALLVLALNVVAFVTRIAEKCRLANRFSRCSERTISTLQSEEPAILKHQQTQPTSLGFASLARRQLHAHDPKNVEANVWQGVTNGEEGS